MDTCPQFRLIKTYIKIFDDFYKLGKQNKGDVMKFYCNDSAGILFEIAETMFKIQELFLKVQSHMWNCRSCV
jgi:hypothetical protein